MPHRWLVAFACVVLASTPFGRAVAQGEETPQPELNARSGLSRFFHRLPRPRRTIGSKLGPPGILLVPADTIPHGELRPVVHIPALRVTKSTRPDAQLDAAVLTSVGGGASWEQLHWDAPAERWVASWSVGAALLVSGNLQDSNATLDLAPAIVGGLLDNKFQLGVGYNAGSAPTGHRTFLLISIGINFNN
jgi:hypothetical protein